MVPMLFGEISNGRRCVGVVLCVAMRRSMSQRVAACCSMLQDVAVRWIVLQRIAVCCSLLQCVAVS